MNKFLLSISSLVISLALAQFALAGQTKPGSGQQKPGAPGVMTFEQIREACQNPAKFHSQIPPTNIQVSCRDSHDRWIQDGDGFVPMPEDRLVTTSVISDKYVSNAVTGAVQALAPNSACPRFKQVVETLEVVRAVSCDEMIAYTGTAIDFCADALNSLKLTNPAAVNQTETGRLIDSCPSIANQEQQQRPQH